MDENKNQKNLKIFFIKLASISIAVIIIFNVLFNLLISNVNFISDLVSFSDLEKRREFGDKMREDLNDLLNKDKIINTEDRILIYKLYQKLKSEIEEIQ